MHLKKKLNLEITINQNLEDRIKGGQDRCQKMIMR